MKGDPSSSTISLVAESDDENVDEVINNDKDDIQKVSDAHSFYDPDILKSIVTELPKSASVTISFADNYPVSIKTEEEDGDLSVEYIIAPRVKRE